jgi:uncharacterized integral membrane protein
MKYVYSVLVLLLALFLAAFIQQNGSAIQLKYFYWSTPHLPVSLYMILSFAAGYALAVLVGFASGVRFRLRASGAEREVRQLRSEIQKLKEQEIEAVGKQFEEGPTEPDTSEDEAAQDAEPGSLNTEKTETDPDSSTAIKVLGGEEEK